jgi:hypothetical protein
VIHHHFFPSPYFFIWDQKNRKIKKKSFIEVLDVRVVSQRYDLVVEDRRDKTLILLVRVTDKDVVSVVAHIVKDHRSFAIRFQFVVDRKEIGIVEDAWNIPIKQLAAKVNLGPGLKNVLDLHPRGKKCHWDV